jgi:hypothetical protein
MSSPSSLVPGLVYSGQSLRHDLFAGAFSARLDQGATDNPVDTPPKHTHGILG